jgi:ABC-type branched-subunit amino acid transport system substrate-binding protein
MLPGSFKLVSVAALCIAVGFSTAAFAQKHYDAGASDTEIKVGNIMPYSGPASSYSLIGKTEEAYFRKINDEGGINGRKITFISYDDAYSPSKAVEQARKLVENDEVLLVFQPLGTPSGAAMQKYLNGKKVPQLFVGSGATRFGDPQHSPWTMGWQPNYQSEGRIYAKYILEHYPNGKIAALWQNADSGKDQMKGLRDGLGDKASMIIADASYETSYPTIDSQVAKLKDSGADIFVLWGTPKAGVQAIRKVAQLNWKPVFLIGNTLSSVASVLKPAGFENAKGIITSAYLKDPSDPAWTGDEGVAEWTAFMDKYMPDADRDDSSTVYGYASAQTLVQVLRQCGDDLTRANVMKQAADLKDFRSPMLLPGITINTSPADYFPIEQLQLRQFDGQAYKLMDGVLTGEVRGDH